MWFYGQESLRRGLSVASLILFYLSGLAFSQQSSAPDASLANRQTGICVFKTINYITHTLPQQCLRTSWPGEKGAADGAAQSHDCVRSSFDNQTTISGACHATIKTDSPIERSGGDSSTPLPTDTATEAEPTPRPFMSFEDWKEMMLRKAGQDPADLKSRKTPDRAIEHDRVTKISGLDSLGDDGEIDLNFDVVSEKISNIASAPQVSATETAAPDQQQEPVLYDDGRTQYYRSKDAGKTCKERFSYSSFDAGATVLKTNKGAKNAKAILVENKDSYMLLECSAENKFVIVELSDDILVDTVVLANFEFFSSMIRQFRVSVSDRYPVKADKWKDLGTFEAKNSRDIQPFLVQNPLIWAKYVRIEFLSHYGNEYYCPVSLLRVHGTRMLESWKDTETAADEEDTVDEPAGELPDPSSDSAPVDDVENPENETSLPIIGTTQEMNIKFCSDPLQPRFIFRSDEGDNSSCLTWTTSMSPATSQPSLAYIRSWDQVGSAPQGKMGTRHTADQTPDDKFASASTTGYNQAEGSVMSPAATAVSADVHQISTNSDSKAGASENMTNSISSKSAPQATVQPRAKNNSTAAPASPTVQESFFKAVSKRLQLLEANVTLSLQYIEDQSRSLQEIQQSAERKQLSRIDIFLDNLNHTVLSELRTVRQQYDQIWQSTVIALESQREQSQRETVALSSRLNILADEVVFQKRMAIVQAILLLSCLILVIFSRAMTQPILASSFDLGRAPSLDHPLPGLPIDRDPGNAYATGFDKFGRPFENETCTEIGRSDVSPNMVRASSEAPAQQLTPTSDVGQTRYALESGQYCPNLDMTMKLLPAEDLIENGSYDSFSSSSDVPSP